MFLVMKFDLNLKIVSDQNLSLFDPAFLTSLFFIPTFR